MTLLKAKLFPGSFGTIAAPLFPPSRRFKEVVIFKPPLFIISLWHATHLLLNSGWIISLNT